MRKESSLPAAGASPEASVPESGGCLEVFYKPSGFLVDLIEVHRKRGSGTGADEEKKQLLWYGRLASTPWEGLYHLGWGLQQIPHGCGFPYLICTALQNI